MTSSTDAVTRDWDGLTIPTAGTYAARRRRTSGSASSPGT